MARVIYVTNMVTEHLIARNTKKREMKSRIRENPVSTENATTVKESDTGLLIVG